MMDPPAAERTEVGVEKTPALALLGKMQVRRSLKTLWSKPATGTEKGVNQGLFVVFNIMRERR
jgi:hypothetical protein